MKYWKILEKNPIYRVTGLKSLVLLHFLYSPLVLDNYFTFSFLSSNFLSLLHIITLCWWLCYICQREKGSSKESEENFHMLTCLSMHLHIYICVPPSLGYYGITVYPNSYAHPFSFRVKFLKILICAHYPEFSQTLLNPFQWGFCSYQYTETAVVIGNGDLQVSKCSDCFKT